MTYLENKISLSSALFQLALVLIHDLIGAFKYCGNTLVVLPFGHTAGDNDTAGCDRVFVMYPDVFYQFSPNERMIILKNVKEGKIETNINDLVVKLTPSELKYLSKNSLMVK